MFFFCEKFCIDTVEPQQKQNKQNLIRFWLVILLILKTIFQNLSRCSLQSFDCTNEHYQNNTQNFKRNWLKHITIMAHTHYQKYLRRVWSHTFEKKKLSFRFLWVWVLLDAVYQKRWKVDDLDCFIIFSITTTTKTENSYWEQHRS